MGRESLVRKFVVRPPLLARLAQDEFQVSFWHTEPIACTPVLSAQLLLPVGVLNHEQLTDFE